ncbi:phage tail protein [Streptococcus suis]|uniref:phage tail protein n=1 Tax=Streptococcus suis TaxID=1307 RepID=UPI001EE90039|nr:phage tail protein [Streptococcus suis]
MLTFLDHKGNEIGALTTFKYINSVNGERSLSGTVHGNLEIEKGWGVRFEDEYYKVIYAKPKSLGKINIVQFDAVHQFFWDFDKSSVYSELDGSYPFQTFLDHIFNGSGYRYKLEVEVGSLRKQNFGLKKRLELFNDLIKHAGVEFQVRGKVVRILERTGTDLSTVVRKKLNLNDLSIEKRIGDFITYQKGLGAWHDENDHSKGRLEVEYVSPLVTIYGRLEGEPYVDERFTISENFLEVLKKTVEDSYSISVQLTMEDLHKAGYRYTRPLAGDYITVIDEEINFKERVRIVSFETEYDIKGQVIDHTVTCNDIGSVKKQSVGYSSLKSSVADVSKETESAIKTANRALVSADGKSTVYFGTEFPQDVPKGTLTKGDTLYLKVGDKTKMYYWNGAEWLEPPVVNDVEVFKESINTEIAQVNASMQAQSEEHDRQVADILSKTHSVESLANQAKSDAASAITRANQVKTEAIADARAQIATVNQALNTAKSELQTAIANADQKARDSQASATALRNDLNSQANKILAQAQAQTALANRVSTVETLADGTRSTVAELSKTISKATGDIASVTSRTKTVEDTLSQTRTQYEALTQTVNSQTGQIESINRKTADLQSGIDGVTERFENLRIEDNLLLNSSFNENLNQWQGSGVTIIDGKARITGEFNKTKSVYQSIKSQIANDDVNQAYIASVAVKVSNYVAGSRNPYLALYINGIKNDSTNTWFGGTYLTANHLNGVNNRGVVQFATTFRINVPRNQIKSIEFYIYARDFTGEVEFEKVSLRRGNIDLGWQASPEDLRSEIATYKRTAEESSAELSRQIQLVDGKAVDAKTYAQQTADAIKTRLESLEIYKNAEGDRAEQYLTASREETARQLTAERTAIATNYVAKSTYDENVRGTTLKLNEVKSTADTAKQNLATYQNTVDRKLEELTSSTQTLDGKINTASAKITQNATEISKRLTSTQVESAITGKGYQTKSQVDSNITGRGYITSGALQPYALSTTVQNLVQETADSFSRTISRVENKIPTKIGVTNLLGGTSSDWKTIRVTRFNGLIKSYNPQEWALLNIKTGDSVTFSVDVKTTSGKKLRSRISFYGANTHYYSETFVVNGEGRLSVTGIVPDGITSVQLFVDANLTAATNTGVTDESRRREKLEIGAIPTDWSPAPEDLATVTALHDVKDTVSSHTRTIGAVGTTGSILDNISKVTQTANGLVQEVSGANGLKTQVSTLAGSYAIKNLTKAGDVLGQINLNKDGSVKIDGKLVQITGTTYIQDGVISSAKIASLDAGKITTGTLDAARIAVNSIDGSKLVFDQAFFNSFMANEAYLKQIFAKNAFITSVQSTNMSADMIKGGLLISSNGATNFDLNNGNLLFNNNYGYIRRTANDKIFEITTLLTEKSDYSPEGLSSKFMIRKSDSSRQSGVSFNLYTTVNGKPTATTQIYSDSFKIISSDYTTLFSLGSKNSYLGTLNLQNWGDIPVAVMSGGLVVKDIGIGGHTESLLKVVERLCSKTGLMWI